MILNPPFSDRYSDKRFSRSRCIAERTIEIMSSNENARSGGELCLQRVHATLNSGRVEDAQHTMRWSRIMETFLQESASLSQLNHEKYRQGLRYRTNIRTVFIVMEYLEGVSLAQGVRGNSRLSLSETLRIVLQVCHGLHMLMLRVLCMENQAGQYFLSPRMSARKVVDFGLAVPPGPRLRPFGERHPYISP